MIDAFLRCFLFCLLYLVAAIHSLAQDTIRKVYYDNGRLSSFRIKKDNQSFYEKLLYENGKLEGEGIVRKVNGKELPVKYKYYYENGKLKAIRTDTSWVEYDPDGKLALYKQLAGGKKNGISKSYIDGKLSIMSYFKNDKKDGVEIVYDLKNGNKVSEETFSVGERTGEAKYYDEKGKLTRRVQYKKGCPESAILYDKAGNISKTLRTKNELQLLGARPLYCD